MKSGRVSYFNTKIEVSTGDLVKAIIARLIPFILFIPINLCFLILGLAASMIMLISLIIEKLIFYYFKEYIWEFFDDFRLSMGHFLQNLIMKI